MIPTRALLPLCIVSLLVVSGCGMKRDAAVEEQIQARYALHDAAFATRDPNAVTALCAKEYNETSSGLISTQIAPSNTVTVSTKGRVGSRRSKLEIESLEKYRAFLAAYFAETQAVSVNSRTTEARVNNKKDHASVTVSRDVQATLAAAEGKQPMSVIVQETLSDTWVKQGNEWMKSGSEVTSSIIKRDRASEME